MLFPQVKPFNYPNASFCFFLHAFCLELLTSSHLISLPTFYSSSKSQVSHDSSVKPSLTTMEALPVFLWPWWTWFFLSAVFITLWYLNPSWFCISLEQNSVLGKLAQHLAESRFLVLLIEAMSSKGWSRDLVNLILTLQYRKREKGGPHPGTWEILLGHEPHGPIRRIHPSIEKSSDYKEAT